MKKISIEKYANMMVKMADTYNIKISQTKVENLIKEECPNGKIGEIFVYKFLQALKNKAEEIGKEMEKEDYESFKEILIETGNNLSIEDEKENIAQRKQIPKQEQIPRKTYHPKDQKQQTIIDEGRRQEARKDKKPHKKLSKKIKLALGGVLLGGTLLAGVGSSIKQTTPNNINVNTVKQEQELSFSNQDLSSSKGNIDNLNYIDYTSNQDLQIQAEEETQEKNELFNMIVEEYNQKYPDTPISVEDLGIIYTISSRRIYTENGKYILNYDLDKAKHPNAELISAGIPTYIVLNNKTMSPVSAIAEISTKEGFKPKNIEVEQYILDYNSGTYTNDGKTIDLLIDNPKNIEEIDEYNEDIYKLYEKQCIERQNDLKEKEQQEKLEELKSQGVQIAQEDDGR